MSVQRRSARRWSRPFNVSSTFAALWTSDRPQHASPGSLRGWRSADHRARRDRTALGLGPAVPLGAMREISPAQNLSAEEYLAHLPPPFRALVRDIRTQKEA